MRRLRYLTHRHRTRSTNVVLGGLLALHAGAINAGGFLVLQRYTSHMTGFLAQLGDGLVLQHWGWAGQALGVVLAFLAGATVCGALMEWAWHRQLRCVYALPLMLEAVLLLPFGLLGSQASSWSLSLPLIVVLLAFIMGLQNAVGSAASIGGLRTTHMTGNVTDVGSDLGRWLYLRAAARRTGTPVPPRGARMVACATLLVMFVLGCLLGAWSFSALGFVSVVPLALLLLSLSVPPMLQDLRRLAMARHL